MRKTRRIFLQSTAASCALASLPRGVWSASTEELQRKLAADPLRP